MLTHPISPPKHSAALPVPRSSRRPAPARLALGIAWLAGCGAGGPPPQRPEPAAWESPLYRDHPLVGRIYDVRQQRFVGEDTMLSALAKGAALLGEQHNNADHHRLQARVVAALAQRRVCRGAVFEMIDEGDQQALDRHLLASRRRGRTRAAIDALAQVLRWDQSGWPAFSLYRPVLSAAYVHCDRLVAGSFDRETVMEVGRAGLSSVEAAFVRHFGLAQPLAPEVKADMREEMKQAHCNMLLDDDNDILDRMVLIQRLRDAKLAYALHQTGSDHAVLIAGNGHVRRDRGVPRYLSRAFKQPSKVLSFMEVDPAWTTPAALSRELQLEALPYDFLWFTPSTDHGDPCASLRPQPPAKQPAPPPNSA